MRSHAKAPSAGSTSDRGKVLTLGLAVCLLAVLALAPSASASRVFQGSLCTTSAAAPLPALGGTCNTPRGVAVNSSGNGGVPAGTTYVVDGTNNRIQRFNSAGQFISAWGRDVVGVDEVQTVTVRAGSGQYKLNFAGQSTANINATATAAQVRAALAAISSIGSNNNVLVSGGPGNVTGSSPYVITFTSGLGGADLPQITATNVSLAGGNPASEVNTATTVTGTGGNGLEVCSLAAECKAGISALPTGGAFNAAQGIAVNQSTGNVYVTNASNRRVDEFSSTGGFIRAWGAGVITGGASGIGTLASGSTAVTAVATASKAFAVGQGLTGTGIQPGTEIVAVGAGFITLSQPATASGAQALSAAAGTGNVALNERQTVTIGGNPSGGTFTLAFKLTAPDSTTALTTAAIPFNATAAEVETALKNLANIGSGNVSVSVSPGGDAGGGATPGGPWTVEFTGTRFADTNVEQMTATATGLTPAGGKTVTVATSLSGASAAEACTVAAECTLGQAGTLGGQFTTLGQPVVDSSGDLYVADSGNQRVQKFDESGAFDRAWGWDVVQPGGTAESTATFNERQRITINPAFGAPISSGSFALTFDGQTTTPGIAWNAPIKKSEETVGGPQSVEAALEGLSNVGVGDVALSGSGPLGSSGGTFVVEFTGALGLSDVPQLSIDLTALCCQDASGFKPTASIITFLQGGLGPAFEICTVAAQCKAGLAGPSAGLGGQFETGMPTSLAIGASGNVYATDDPNGRVQKFSSAGAYLGSLAPGGTAPFLLAGDQAGGEVFVSSAFTSPSEKRIQAFDSSDSLLETIPTGVTALNGLGYDSENEGLYATTTTTSHRVLLFAPIPPAEVEINPATEVGATSAKLHGSIAIPSLGGGNFNASYFFEYSGDNGLNWSQTPSVEASIGPVPVAVSRTIAGLQPNLTYRFRLVVTTSTTDTSAERTFTTLGAKPTITKTIAMPIGGDSAKLTGAVNPNNSPTTYHFEWGTSAAYGNEVPDFDAFTGAGGQPVSVGSTIKGLQLSTTYHFRIVATNASGTAFGPDTTFTTNNFPGVCPNEAIRDQQGSQYLPDCRAFEQVSPADKRPVGTVGDLFTTQLKFQASPDGSKIYYPLLNGLDDATAGGNLQYLASRAEGGWLSTQLSSPNLVYNIPSTVGDNTTDHILYNSPDLSCTILESAQPLTADTPAENLENKVYSLYRRDATGSYTLLTSNPPSNSAPDANTYVVDWVTPDCSHVLFETEYKFLPGTPASGKILYEWANGTLRLAGLLPDGSVAAGTVGSVTNAEAGGGNTNLAGTAINSLSSDGSRVFFTAVSNEGVDSGKLAIFVSENGTPAVNISRSSNPNGASDGSELQGITPKGSHVFFLAKYGLTPGSSSNGPTSCNLTFGTLPTAGEGCDLYDYNVDTETLTDLSADANPADTKGAGVIGMVDASDDGSHVYFAARGQLIPGQGNTEAQNLAAPNSAYNIYLSHSGQLSFVGVMTGRQTTSALGGSNLSSAFKYWAADATPSGSHLLFVSTANVTGYASGGVTEAYRYSAAADSTVCVSCRTDGLPSVGTESTGPITYKHSEDWGPNNPTSHRPRAISDDGSRVFFTMPDALAPGAVSGAPNIYEWEGGKVYLLAAGTEGTAPAQRLLFADSSASGDHVFFTAKSRLVPQDFDTTRDLYVARVGGGFPYEPPAPPCDILADECQDPPAPQPGAAGAAPSEAFSGPANAAAQPASKKKRGKKRHKKRNKQAHKRQAKRNADNNRRAAR